MWQLRIQVERGKGIEKQLQLELHEAKDALQAAERKLQQAEASCRESKRDMQLNIDFLNQQLAAGAAEKEAAGGEERKDEGVDGFYGEDNEPRNAAAEEKDGDAQDGEELPDVDTLSHDQLVAVGFGGGGGIGLT